MLITLCYLYLWARWGAGWAGLIRHTVRRLHRARCAFVFGCCRGGAGCPPPQRRRRRRQGSPGLGEEPVCLRLGDKVFFTEETPQVPAAPGLLRGRPGLGWRGGACCGWGIDGARPVGWVFGESWGVTLGLSWL